MCYIICFFFVVILVYFMLTYINICSVCNIFKIYNVIIKLLSILNNVLLVEVTKYSFLLYKEEFNIFKVDI